VTHGETFALFLGLGVILAGARLLGEVARRLGQAAVLGEIIAGILLGPTVLGRLAPASFATIFPQQGASWTVLDGMSTVAVALFLLVAGMEVDLSRMWRQGRTAAAVSVAGLLFPFALGLGAAWMAPGLMGMSAGGDRLHFALFMATALSISALPVIAKTLMDLNLFRTDIGMVVIAAAIFQDLAGWISFAVVLSLIGTGSGAGFSLGGTVVAVLAFTLAMLTVVRWLFHLALPYVQAYASWPGGVLGVILSAALLGAAFTEWIGVHAIFGSFLVGVAVGDSSHLRARTRATIEQFVSFVFAPLFFAGIGLKVDFVAHFQPGLVAVVLVIACVGKLIGAGFGARLTGTPWRESAAIGLAMNSRGAMEIILGTLALQYALIDQPLFVALVIMALTTSLMAGPLIQRVLARPKARRFVNHLTVKGFVPHLRAGDAEAAIHELAAAAAAASGGDAGRFADAALQRECSMPTGLSNGLAVPHARLPGLSAPVVALGLARPGIDFSAPDGRPAEVVVLLITGDDEHAGQLDLLADIARTFADEAARELVLKARGYTELLAALRTAGAG